MSLARTETVIAYSSHKLQPYEKLYLPHEREMLAVVPWTNGVTTCLATPLALGRRPDHVIANDNPSLSAQELKLQCSRTLQDTVNRLNVLCLPHQNSSLPTLHPLGTTIIAGESEIIALVEEEAQLDPEQVSVTTAAEEGQLPDFTERDGLVWNAFTYMTARPAAN